ncbi:MAG: TauD/TfdA family dioxygenase [Gammaproteobacteria bacterium]|nr:TauD/TfdA family dioxygenase [Gammaproteobacteria bacterium]
MTSEMSVDELDAPFGAVVNGVDVSRLGPGEMKTLTEVLYANRLIVLKGQSLDKAAYLRFGRSWGEPIPHVLDHMRMPGFPELLVVGNTEQKDKDNAIRNGAALWHTDQSYEAVPATATMLYSIQAPAVGGETQFCDMARAYDALSDDMKARIGSLEVAHKYGRGKLRADDLDVNPLANDDQDSRVPVIYHPLVMEHPITSRPTLYALGHGAHAIKGMSDGESAALLEELKTHVLQEAFIYRHRYEVGDIAIWDTLQTMHRATPIDYVSDADTARLLWRISVRGIPQVYEGRSADQ